MAGRQVAYAAELPQLTLRVERYLVDAAAELELARAAMNASAERLREDDLKASAPHQEKALEHLAAAEKLMRGFWDELMETLARISKDVEGSPHGAEGEEERAKEDLLMTLMREIVRVGRILKALDLVMAKTSAWTEASPDTIDPKELEATTAKQFELRDTGLDIVGQLMPLGGEAGTVTEAVMEASQFMEGAADMLKVKNFHKALERQETAKKFLEEAWQVIAMSMSTLNEGKESEETEPQDEEGEAEFKAGEESAVAGAGGADDGRPWYWDLAPQLREAVEQSQEGDLPARYEPAIKRYYERLSRSRQR
jgi:hypothetical protein